MSHTSLTYHIVISAYRRKQVIDPDHEKELYKYMYDLATKRGVYVRRIGGMPNHVHILCDIPAKESVAAFVRLLKSESSKFMRVNDHFTSWYGRSEGYGAFTVDASLRETRRKYIINQREHHCRRGFEQEYMDLLLECGLPTTSGILGDEE